MRSCWRILGFAAGFPRVLPLRFVLKLLRRLFARLRLRLESVFARPRPLFARFGLRSLRVRQLGFLRLWRSQFAPRFPQVAPALDSLFLRFEPASESRFWEFPLLARSVPPKLGNSALRSVRLNLTLEFDSPEVRSLARFESKLGLFGRFVRRYALESFEFGFLLGSLPLFGLARFGLELEAQVRFWEFRRFDLQFGRQVPLAPEVAPFEFRKFDLLARFQSAGSPASRIPSPARSPRLPPAPFEPALVPQPDSRFARTKGHPQPKKRPRQTGTDYQQKSSSKQTPANSAYG